VEIQLKFENQEVKVSGLDSLYFSIECMQATRVHVRKQ